MQARGELIKYKQDTKSVKAQIKRKGEFMTVGQFVFMLHSHLPYYRKAGMWPFGEENLYECMAETYVPLLNAISELYDLSVML